jgi:hypothetical protein
MVYCAARREQSVDNTDTLSRSTVSSMGQSIRSVSNEVRGIKCLWTVQKGQPLNDTKTVHSI